MPRDLVQKVFGVLGCGKEHSRSHVPPAGHPQHPPQNPLEPGRPAPQGRWTIVNEERALNQSGTYPRLCRLSDGSLLCVSTGFAGPEHILQVSRSTDNGLTFVPHGEIARGTGDVDNAFLLELPLSYTAGTSSSSSSPTVLAAFRNHDRAPDGRGFTRFRITVCRSADGGRTWAYAAQASEVSAAASHGMGLWEPFLRLATRPPAVQLTYSGELAPDDQETFQTTSTDGGRTWSPPRNLRLHPPTARLRDGMQGIAGARDGADGRAALVLVMETTRRAPHFSVEYVLSYDDGATWGHRGVVYVPGRAGRNAGSPQIASAAGGRLAVVFQTDEDVDQPDWPGRAEVKVLFSAGLHGGQLDWSRPPLRVGGVSSMWPGVFMTAADEVLAVYEHRGKPVGKPVRWVER
ncbi:Sialidase [Xylariomycetidae sp. FL0641]|nr:Sialidase [Xylariomycetidae sp. FL0641]